MITCKDIREVILSMAENDDLYLYILCGTCLCLRERVPHDEGRIDPFVETIAELTISESRCRPDMLIDIKDDIEKRVAELKSGKTNKSNFYITW